MIDKVKLAIAVALVGAGIWAYYWLGEGTMFVLRLLAVIAGIAAGAVVAWFSEPGRQFGVFAGEAVAQVQERGWPNAQGTMQTKPAPIPEKEVEAIMQQMREGVEKPKPKVLFEVGEMVRVKDGPFTDFQGTVEDVNYEKSRLRVAVTIFGRSTPVELEFGQVEKA